MGKPEARVENYLVRKAKARGWCAFKFVSPGHSGVPDRIVVGDGRVAFVELKSPSGKLSELQKTMIEKLRSLGAEVHVCYDREQVDAVLAGMSKGDNQNGNP